MVFFFGHFNVVSHLPLHSPTIFSLLGSPESSDNSGQSMFCFSIGEVIPSR